MSRRVFVVMRKRHPIPIGRMAMIVRVEKREGLESALRKRKKQ